MISVIIPTYNRSEELLKSIESVLKQTYKDIEIIVVDDGSTDLTEKNVKEIEDNRIVYVKHKHNKGGCAARNTGIIKARGEYIAFQDSDDIWHETKLEKQLNALQRNNADVVFCKMKMIRGEKEIDTFPLTAKTGFLKKGDNVCGIGTQTLLGKSEVFKKNRFDKKMPRLQELELLIRLLNADYKVYCCEEALVDYYYCEAVNCISGNPHKLLKACKLLDCKFHGLSKEYRATCKELSKNLFVMSYSKELINKEKKEMRLIALRFYFGTRSLIKFFLIKMKLYPVVYRLINKCGIEHME